MECNLSFLFPFGVVPMRRVSLERPVVGVVMGEVGGVP